MPDTLHLAIPCTSCGAIAACVTLPSPERASSLLEHLDPIMRTIASPIVVRVLGMLAKWQCAGGEIERDAPGHVGRALNLQCGSCAAGAIAAVGAPGALAPASDA